MKLSVELSNDDFNDIEYVFEEVIEANYGEKYAVRLTKLLEKLRGALSEG